MAFRGRQAPVVQRDRLADGLQPPVQPSVAKDDPMHRPAGPQRAPPLFKPGDSVRVPRYGDGKVAQVAGEEVTVLFPDRARRRFLMAYVQRQ